jgi:hypothetical protein
MLVRNPPIALIRHLAKADAPVTINTELKETSDASSFLDLHYYHDH